MRWLRRFWTWFTTHDEPFIKIMIREEVNPWENGKENNE